MSENEKIAVYVENMGRGNASLSDSLITVRDFPNRKDGAQAIGIFATKTEMPETHLKAFKEVLEVLYPKQLNVLSSEEYEAAKKKALAPTKTEETTEPPQPTQDELMEKTFYDAAMEGSTKEINDYISNYPNGKYKSDVIERSVFLVATTDPTAKKLKVYLTKYPEGQYVTVVNNILAS